MSEFEKWYKDVNVGDKFYTSPPQQQWVGLSDEDIKKVFEELMIQFGRDYRNDVARAIEAKLKQLNTKG